MKYEIERMAEKHLPLVDAFSCVESEELLKQYTSNVRRRIRKHSRGRVFEKRSMVGAGKGIKYHIPLIRYGAK